jgi:hypothetical protein
MHLSLHRRSSSGPGLLGPRAWAWLHQAELDRELAGGADATDSPALETRAKQLIGPHFRRELVAQLDAALDKAEHPPHWRSVSVPVRACEVRAARDSLTALRQALLDAGVPSVRGVALAACLINDPDSPLYRQTGADIAQVAESATTALTAGAGSSRR